MASINDKIIKGHRLFLTRREFLSVYFFLRSMFIANGIEKREMQNKDRNKTLKFALINLMPSYIEKVHILF